MTPQTGAFLDKSRELLEHADTMLGVGLNEAAGRTAYMAGYHAAQALIFEAMGRVFKTHSAVQGEFGRLVRDEPGVGPDVRAFLGRAYALKAVADYEIGPGSKVPAERAREAIQTARRVVECVTGLLPPDEHDPHRPDAPAS